MPSWVKYILLVVLLAGGGGVFLWWQGIGQYEVKNPVYVKFTGENQAGVTVMNDKLIAEFAGKIKRTTTSPKITINFVNDWPAKMEGKIVSFWPRSVAGEGGIACGQPKYSDKLSTAQINIYFTKNFVLGRLDKAEAEKQLNNFFRLCLAMGINGQSGIDSDFGNYFRPINQTYLDSQMIKL